MKVLACTTRIALLLLLVSLLVDNVEDITSTDHSTLIHSATMVDNLLRRWYMLITTVILVSCLVLAVRKLGSQTNFSLGTITLSFLLFVSLYLYYVVRYTGILVLPLVECGCGCQLSNQVEVRKCRCTS